MRKPLSLLMMLLVVLATACERRTADLLNVAIVSEVDAEPAIRAAQDRARKQPNAKLELLIRNQAQGKPFTLRSRDGVIDFRRKRTRYTLDFGFEVAPGVRYITLIFSPQAVYIGLPEPKGDKLSEPADWARFDIKIADVALNTITGGGAADPADSYLPLRGLRPGVDFVRSEDIGSTRTSEFHGTIDPNESLRRATTSKERDLIRRQLLGIGELIPIAAWIGADGLTYRYSVTLGVGQAATLVQASFFDYGDAGGVNLPPSSRVTNVTRLEQLEDVFGDFQPAPAPSPDESPSSSPSPSPSGTTSATQSPSPSPSG